MEKLRRLIYVSWARSSTPGIVLSKLLRSFRDLDCQVVLATGNRVSVTCAPKNFVVERYVPQLEILQRAAAFVSHGGMNSASESLYHGVPLVVIPQMGEQMIVGLRLEQLGAGICLGRDQVTIPNLRRSVLQILDQGDFRTASRRIGDSFRSAGGVKHAADLIAAYVQAVRPSAH